MKPPLHIKDIIKRMKRSIPFVNVKKVMKVEPNVMTFLPQKFHPFITGMTLRNKKLTIKVNNNATMMELQNFYARGMLNYLQNVLPEECEIKNVVFKNV